MNGLPPTADLMPLVGARVIQLCFGENEFQIRFDNGARVVIESEVVLRHASSVDVRICRYAQSASLLCDILGKRVMFAARAADGGMDMRFEGAAELQICNDSVTYESFQVHIAGQIYVA